MSDLPPINIRHRIIFDGGDANEHKLEAYPAAQSLEGLIWAVSIAVNFGVTGKVRQRGDLSSAVKLYISPAKRGSVVHDLNILVQQNPFIAMMVGGWAINTVTPYVNSLISYSFTATASGIRKIPHGAKRFFKRMDDNDLEKLVKRIEPPLTRAHAAIGKTADTIEIKSPRKQLVHLDQNSKLFLEARARNEHQIIETNITSFNVLTGNGRLYDPIEGGTVAFSLRADTQFGTQNTIADSIRHYAMGHQGMIRITAQRVETLDGRLKQLLVSNAEEIPKSDWLDGVNPITAKRI